MSDMSHTGPIKTPKQLFWTSVFAFILPVSIIMGLVAYVTKATNPAAGNQGQDQELAVAQRIQRVGMVELRDANRPLQSGEEVFKAQCAACHTAGLLGAPKFGNAADWAARLGAGYDALLESALKGKNSMSPQGGGAFSDVEVARALVYMTNASGGHFPEPKVPEAPAAQ